MEVDAPPLPILCSFSPCCVIIRQKKKESCEFAAGRYDAAYRGKKRDY